MKYESATSIQRHLHLVWQGGGTMAHDMLACYIVFVVEIEKLPFSPTIGLDLWLLSCSVQTYVNNVNSSHGALQVLRLGENFKL